MIWMLILTPKPLQSPLSTCLRRRLLRSWIIFSLPRIQRTPSRLPRRLRLRRRWLSQRARSSRSATKSLRKISMIISTIWTPAPILTPGATWMMPPGSILRTSGRPSTMPTVASPRSTRTATPLRSRRSGARRTRRLTWICTTAATARPTMLRPRTLSRTPPRLPLLRLPTPTPPCAPPRPRSFMTRLRRIPPSRRSSLRSMPNGWPSTTSPPATPRRRPSTRRWSPPWSAP
mmetsp:Transcript_39483/g.104885  ORF Transcript_39483/g.104885 Transcript_39483/m.104885 type:complete len:232 (+) Transcript_39483:199-894(+)